MLSVWKLSVIKTALKTVPVYLETGAFTILEHKHALLLNMSCTVVIWLSCKYVNLLNNSVSLTTFFLKKKKELTLIGIYLCQEYFSFSKMIAACIVSIFDFWYNFKPFFMGFECLFHANWMPFFNNLVQFTCNFHDFSFNFYAIFMQFSCNFLAYLTLVCLRANSPMKLSRS